VERTIIELQGIIKDLKNLKKNRMSIVDKRRTTIQNEPRDNLTKASKDFLKKYGLLDEG
jgi:hypothetical protein